MLVFMKLKLGVSYSVLGGLFGLSVGQASEIFSSTLNALHKAVQTNIIWLDRETIKARMPPCFQSYFPNTRVIIDASEIEIQVPSTQYRRIMCWSNYKQRHMVKFLIAIAPSGEIMFILKAFGGRITDTELTNRSGFISFLEDGDDVMSDKGFPHIESQIANTGGVLIMPPFFRGNQQFTPQQNLEGYWIASARIHVKRAIQRLKRFEILSFLQTHMLKHIDKILVLISFITNLQNDLIKVE